MAPFRFREVHDPHASRRVYGPTLMPRRRPTPADHQEATRLGLGAIPEDWQAVLAVEALDLSGASRAEPLDYEDLRGRYLPEISFTGKIAQLKRRYVLHAMASRRGGLQTDLLDDVGWWRNDDFWVWAYYALVNYVRAAADRTRTKHRRHLHTARRRPITRP
jgi:hypothetical protein